MYKIYLKQAWQMLKEDKVISIISIFGTALAITMIMVVILTQRVQTTNIAPEVNRERTMYIKHDKEENKVTNSININNVNGNHYKQYLTQLKVPEAISLHSRTRTRIFNLKDDESLRSEVTHTDVNFWKIYRFSFIEGKPFSQEDFQSGIPVAVISKSFAQKFFKGEPALGKEFFCDNKTFRVCGIVKDVSSICEVAYSQVWVPYTSIHDNLDHFYFEVSILAKRSGDFSAIKKEVRESEIRNNPELEKKSLIFIGPYSREEQLVKIDNFTNDTPNMLKTSLRFYFILAILLLIPAINLSGFSLFKIINRTSEIGIRKAFGANKIKILTQVLYENFLTSIIGGIIGLILSFVVVTLLSDRLFASDSYKALGDKMEVPVSALVSPSVFFYVFLVCLVLNLVSSGIPALRASRMKIVDSIRN